MGFCVWYLIASFALTMNHRFFSHAAFKTSRVWRFVLGVMTLYGMQFGPIWWSSKHRLHHKVCDTPKDPHSWKESSFFYAWIGWFHGHKEQGIDVAYVHPSFLDDEPLFALPAWLIPLHSFGERGSPGYVEGGERRMRPKGGTGKEKVIATELLLIGRFWWVPTTATALLLYCWLGWSTWQITTRFVAPTLHLQIPILMFNVMFHPPDDLHPDNKRIAASQQVCFALDSVFDPLSAMLGENCHEDHHHFPARAKRPGGVFGVDLSWWLVLQPMLALGLIWEPKLYQKIHKSARERLAEVDVLEVEAEAERTKLNINTEESIASGTRSTIGKANDLTQRRASVAAGAR